jgi:hypothetical protein
VVDSEMNRALPDGDLWAITCYFNPVGFRHRLTNYRVFCERLMAPLVAVELAYGQRFELGPDDAEILVQLRGSDVMWQKERLLNIALDRLPASCTKVAWLDCDIVFERDDWTETVSRGLDRFQILQVFDRVHHMPRDLPYGAIGRAATEHTRASAVSAIVSGLPATDCLGENLTEGRFRMSRGLAWAARRELLEAHRLYDANVIGGGDRAIAAAAFGLFDAAAKPHHMGPRHRDWYLRWAEPFRDAVAGSVSYVEGSIFHLWHGSDGNRRGGERHAKLAEFEFDPFTDITGDASGCWRWASAKPTMHAYVRDYFRQRREDG